MDMYLDDDVGEMSVGLEDISAYVMRLVGKLSVEETNTKIMVKGVPANVMAKDIAKCWETTAINKNIFTHLSSSAFTIPKFFAIELLYMLESLNANRGIRLNRIILRELIKQLKENTWLSTINREFVPKWNWKQLDRLNLDLLVHQKDFLREAEENQFRFKLNGYLLASPPGTGKTLAGIAYCLIRETKCNIVVCQKPAVIDVWVTHLKTKFKKPPTIWNSVTEEGDFENAEYLIVHYEALGRFYEKLIECKRKTTTILLDESHNLNESDRIRTETFIEIVKYTKTDGCLWESGTPFKAIGAEAVPLLRSIDEYFTEDAAERFTKIFGKSSLRAADIIAHRLGLVMFKVDKDAVVKIDSVEEPPVLVKYKGAEQFTLDAIRTEIRAFIKERQAYYKANKAKYEKIYDDALAYYDKQPRSKEEEHAYKEYKLSVTRLKRGYNPIDDNELPFLTNKFEKDHIIPKIPKAMHNDFKDAKSVVKYVNLKIIGEALGRVLTRRRIDCFNSMVEHAGLPDIIDSSTKKTIIFTSYVETVDIINLYLSGLGYEPIVVYGDTNKDIDSLLKQFRKNDKKNPIIATYDSLSTAVDLTVANTVILFNPPVREYIRNQAISRAARYGQDSTVKIISILLDTGDEPNLSTRFNDIMEWSKEMVDAIMGYDKSVDPTIGMEGLEFNDFDNNKVAIALEGHYRQILANGFNRSTYHALENLSPNILAGINPNMLTAGYSRTKQDVALEAIDKQLKQLGFEDAAEYAKYAAMAVGGAGVLYLLYRLIKWGYNKMTGDSDSMSSTCEKIEEYVKEADAAAEKIEDKKDEAADASTKAKEKRKKAKNSNNHESTEEAELKKLQLDGISNDAIQVMATAAIKTRSADDVNKIAHAVNSYAGNSNIAAIFWMYCGIKKTGPNILAVSGAEKYFSQKNIKDAEELFNSINRLCERVYNGTSKDVKGIAEAVASIDKGAKNLSVEVNKILSETTAEGKKRIEATDTGLISKYHCGDIVKTNRLNIDKYVSGSNFDKLMMKDSVDNMNQFINESFAEKLKEISDPNGELKNAQITLRMAFATLVKYHHSCKQFIAAIYDNVVLEKEASELFLSKVG